MDETNSDYELGAQFVNPGLELSDHFGVAYGNHGGNSLLFSDAGVRLDIEDSVDTRSAKGSTDGYYHQSKCRPAPG